MKINCEYSKLENIENLKPHNRNPNKHGDRQIEIVAKLIDHHGWRHPIIVSKLSDKIVAGHCRLDAAKKLGYEKVPVDYQEFEDEIAEFRFLVSDNKSSYMSEHDDSFMIDGIKDLELDDSDFELMGLDGFEIEKEVEAHSDEDEVPENVEPKTKLGDLYQLGEHRLLCGDSTSIDAVDKLMNGEKADMVFTDPPYNIAEKTKGVASGAPTNKQNEKLMNSEWDKGFVPSDTLNIIPTLISENSTCYIFTSHFLFNDILEGLNSFFDFVGWCSWSKPNPFPSLMKRHWCFDSELCLYATKGKHTFNYPKTGNARSTWEFPIGEGGLHPTQKPIKIPEHAINHSSKNGDIILDLFGGSGSTLIACEKTNRKCFMAELDPHYCDVIVARWEKYTGKKAELIN